MGKSFILKDQAGNAVGYAVQGMQGMCLRVCSGKDGMQATVFYEDGTNDCMDLDAGDEEMTWVHDGAQTLGAVIVFEERIVADSGQQARALYDAHRQKSLREAEKNRAQQTLQSESPAKTQAEPLKKTGEESEPERFPQRRWPPPACWNSAVYRSGAWTQE